MSNLYKRKNIVQMEFKIRDFSWQKKEKRIFNSACRTNWLKAYKVKKNEILLFVRQLPPFKDRIQYLYIWRCPLLVIYTK